jgi:ribosome biogenesis protein MAK21
MSTLNEASYTAACLLIVSELIRDKPELRFQLYSLEQITRTAVSKNNDSDSEEERFVDADKEENVPTAKEASNASKNVYDPLKREPKYANAESCALFELVQLTFHTHPTVKLWATKLLDGELLDYNGDPLLDFGLANFLDRIAYKNPKSLDKVAKFASSRRMAASEQPINTYTFDGTGAENDRPANSREEEEYLYKYFKMRGPKAVDEKKKSKVIEDEEEEDPEMEAYANDLIEKEMKKMN